MSRKKFLILFVIPFLLIPSVFGGSWGEEKVITTGGGPAFIKASDGVYWLAYDELIDNNMDIYLRSTRDLGEWSDPIRVTLHNETDFHPSLLQGDNGLFYIVFTSLRTGNYDLFLTESDDGTKWTEPVQLTFNNESDWYPSLAKDKDGRLIISYSGRIEGKTGIFLKVLEGDEWSDPIPVTEPTSDLYAMVVEGSDRYWLIFVRHTGDYDIRRRANEHEIFLTYSKDLHDWAPPERLTYTKEGAFSLYPAFIKDEENNLWLSYTSDEPGNEEVYIMGSPDGFKWSKPERITGNMEYRESINSSRSFKCDLKSMISDEGTIRIAYECSREGDNMYLISGKAMMDMSSPRVLEFKGEQAGPIIQPPKSGTVKGGEDPTLPIAAAFIAVFALLFLIKRYKKD